MNQPDDYAGFFAMQAYYRDDEDATAADLLRRQRTVFYCAGLGSKAIECGSMESWQLATGRAVSKMPRRRS